MPERARSKLIPASLVYMNIEFIEQALDHLRMIKGTEATLVIMNSICVGIETSVQPRQLTITHVPQLAGPRAAKTKGKRQDLNAINEKVVIQAIKELGSANTRQVGDHLKVGSDTGLRGKIGRTIAKMRLAGLVIGVRGKGGKVMLTSSPVIANRSKRSPITEESVMKVFEDGKTVATKFISDGMGLARRDGSSRVKVAKLLGKLVATNKLEIVEKRGTIRVYKAVT